MAAARVPLLGLQGVRDALTQRFALLTTGHRVAPGRHKTLHAALDWSHGLLSDAERRLFRTLGVFAEGFTLDLVAAVAAGDDADRWSVIDRLAVLVDRSLVATNLADPPRYYLLETMRAYALEQLAAAGEEQEVRRRHAHAITDLFERSDRTPYKEGGAALRAACHAEMPNAREAMTWARRHEPATAIALSTVVASLVTFTLWRGEALAWLAACEPLVDERIDARTRGAWLYEYARQLLMSAHPRAAELARAARDLWRELGDPNMLFRACVVIVRAERTRGPQLDQACADLQALLDKLPEIDVGYRMIAAGALAVAAETRGDMQARLAYREAERAYAIENGNRDQADAAESNILLALAALGRRDEAIAASTVLLQRIGAVDSGNAAYGWINHVDLLVVAGRLAEALESAPRALELARRFDIPLLNDALALLVAKQGRARTAARLIGHALQAYAARSVPVGGNMGVRVDSTLELARRTLDAATVERLVEEGRRLDDAAAERLVFSDVDA
jgi:tetratricopeptide (TPR) repeat protein